MFSSIKNHASLFAKELRSAGTFCLNEFLHKLVERFPSLGFALDNGVFAAYIYVMHEIKQDVIVSYLFKSYTSDMMLILVSLYFWGNFSIHFSCILCITSNVIFKCLDSEKQKVSDVKSYIDTYSASNDISFVITMMTLAINFLVATSLLSKKDVLFFTSVVPLSIMFYRPQVEKMYVSFSKNSKS